MNIAGEIAAKHGCSPGDVENIQIVREWDDVNGDVITHWVEVRFTIKGKEFTSDELLRNAQERVEAAVARHPREMSQAWLNNESVPWADIGLPMITENSGPFSILATTGGLSAHEGVRLPKSGELSHALGKHIDCTNEDLKTRLVCEKKDKVTRFTDRKTGELAVAIILDYHRQKIKDWIDDTTNVKRLHLVRIDLGTTIGFGVVWNQRTRRIDEVGAVHHVTVILEKVPSRNFLPFTIVTAFPFIPRIRI